MNHRPTILAAACALALGAITAAWCWTHGYTLYYGDAEAHLNIARRILDTRTPGGRQIGTVWLPLPHLLIALFAWSDSMWRSGLAGVIPSVTAFAAATGFLFAAARRAFSSTPAAFTTAALFALNPNMLYLQSTPMTEAMLAASLAALLWSTLWFRDSQSLGALLGAAAASNAASLTRYEGWFLIPFATLYLWIVARNKRHAVLFAALAAIGPLAWLAHNQFYWHNALEFYNGPYSAQAIYQRQLARGMRPQPGSGNWLTAAYYYFAAAKLVLGAPLLALAGAGTLAALWRRAWWPLALLALPAAFYIWSIHSSGTPVFVPDLPPYSRYNTRYAIVMLPFAALAAGALVSVLSRVGQARGLRRTLRPPLATVLTLALPLLVVTTWLVADPLSVCWTESRNASTARRQWITQAAEYLASEYRPGDGILFNFGDLAGVLRAAGIPYRESLYQDNGPAWDAALADPAHAREQWAIAAAGDPVSQALANAPTFPVRRQIIVEGAPVITIYHRQP